MSIQFRNMVYCFIYRSESLVSIRKIKKEKEKKEEDT